LPTILRLQGPLAHREILDQPRNMLGQRRINYVLARGAQYRAKGSLHKIVRAMAFP
jgi:hypothetical protein